MERPRCVHCRNPIKDHQAAVGPTEGERTFHEDCWTAAHPDAAPPVPTAPPVADRPAAAEQIVEQRLPQTTSEQRDYERSIAAGGLAALLSPYVKGLPAQRNSAESVPA